VTLVFDAASIVARGPTERSWTHTPNGTPRAILVYIGQNVGSGDEVTGVTYGGVAMTRARYLAGVSGDEDGAVYAYFLGASVPTGPQTVVVSVDATGSDKGAVALSYTASADVEVDATNILDQASGANPSLTLATSAGVETAVSAAIHHGNQAVTNLGAGAGYTKPFNGTGSDFGSQIWGVETKDANHSGGNVTVDWTISNSDDAHMVAVAIKEVAAGGEEKSGTDSGTASETASQEASYAQADSGAGTEAASLSVALSGQETGSGSEVASLEAQHEVSDSGAFAEAATVDQVELKSGVDSGTFSEAATVQETVASDGTDSGTFSEAATVEVFLSGEDSGSLAETAGIEVVLVAQDQATLVEAAAILAGLEASDVASGFDSADLQAVYTGLDSGTFSDFGVAMEAEDIFLEASDVGVFMEEGFVVVQTERVFAGATGEGILHGGFGESVMGGQDSDEKPMKGVP